MRVILLFISSFISSSDLSELLIKNQEFSSDIIIFDSDSIVSKGSMSYIKGDFVYSINHPSKQILAGLEGKLFIQEDLSKTLKAIAEKGKDGFYSGEVAERMVEDIRKNGGIITLNDLKNYQYLPS